MLLMGQYQAIVAKAGRSVFYQIYLIASLSCLPFLSVGDVGLNPFSSVGAVGVSSLG